ncbi:MAG: TlpA disulfide reductase family protein [Chitinophagales bacterium]|nr:TlpA family protein disulfide reductase [Bacteroidota bacterium]MCB9043661.1 TlpA family protein disulfide reductase [Chitinophagales bacterium]
MLQSCQYFSSEKLRNGDVFDKHLYAQNKAGETIYLDSIKNKIVLVDFWATWCKPCRKANPDWQKLYEKYHEARFKQADGFEIFSVSLDEYRGAWQRAVAQDSLDLPFLLIDERGLVDAPWGKKYKFTQLPTSYLLNADGVIIGVDLSPRKVGYVLQDEKLP